MAGTTSATMEHRAVPRLGRDLSVVGLGCWQLGADWGDVPQERAMEGRDDANGTAQATVGQFGALGHPAFLLVPCFRCV